MASQKLVFFSLVVGIAGALGPGCGDNGAGGSGSGHRDSGLRDAAATGDAATGADSGIGRVVRPLTRTPVCQVGACSDGFARTCESQPEFVDCSGFGARCVPQVDLESSARFRWCDCGNVAEGDGLCLGGPVGIVCSQGLGGLSDCGLGRDCVPKPGKPFGISCECNNLPDDICSQGCSADPDCATCTPNCSGKNCGDNGCGGSCGGCDLGRECGNDGRCFYICVPACKDKQCGDDGCGGNCGGCGTGRRCNDAGQCEEVCVPDCEGKQCGKNGCGGLCGQCSGTDLCNAAGQCTPNCTRNCDGKKCGDDGCGKPCRTCPPGSACTTEQQCKAQCTPDCDGKKCGDDGCGGVCDFCGIDEVCDTEGQCEAQCVPKCNDRECGDDGCGGTCGPGCDAPHICWDGAGVCRCDFDARLTYTFDGSGLAFTKPHPDITPGDLVVVEVNLTQQGSSLINTTTKRNGHIMRATDQKTSISFAACVPNIEAEVVYYVINRDNTDIIKCRISQTLSGETDFAVIAPRVDLEAGTCTAMGLRPAK